MTVFEIGAKLGLDSKAFTNGLSSASKAATSFAGGLKTTLSTASKIGVAALGTVTASAGALSGAMVKGVKEVAAYGDNIDKMSQKMGLSAQAYQEWDAIMQHSGASIETLRAGMKTLANAVETGNEAFERLGITQEELQTLNSEQLFARTISALQSVENTTERTYLAGQLLGRGATELGALLNTSAKDTELMRKRVHELGGVMSEEAVKAAAKYTDTLQDMKTAIKSVGRETVSGLIPVVTQLMEGVTDIFAGDENKGFDTVYNSISAIFDYTAKVIPQLMPKVAKIGSSFIKALGKSFVSNLPAFTEMIGNLAFTALSGISDVIPKLLDTGRNFLANFVYSMGEGEIPGIELLGKILDSIVNNAPYYFQYAQMILTNLANKLLDVDYGKLAANLSTLFVNAVNSITDFVKSIDFYKVGEDIADFLNNINWQEVANSLFDLLAAGIKAIPDIAVSFFANADLGNLMTMIGLMGAPKLLGGITDFTSGGEGQELGKAAGQSWSGAFMAGVKAFGLGWALGTYIRDELVEKYGEEKVNDVIGGGAFGVLGLSQEMKVAQEKANSYTYTNKYGQKVTIPMYDEHANYTEAYKKVAMQGPPLPKFGNGGRVTRPTLAIVGEKEPETMVPDSKRGLFGNTYNISINVEGYSIKNDEEFTELLSQKLAELSIRQQRAQGGTAW